MHNRLSLFPARVPWTVLFLVALAVMVGLPLLQGCAAMAAGGPAFVAPKDMAQTEILTVSIASEVLTQADILQTAKVIKPQDARDLAKQTDQVRAGVAVANSLKVTDPAAATDRMSAALTSIKALRDYLAKRGATFTPAASG